MLFEQESTATPSNISIEESQTAGNASIEPIQAIVVAFYVGRVISILSIVLGIPGNVALIVIICRSSFYRFSNGLLLLCIATFDIVRLASTIFYYLIFANIIPLNTINLTIYVAWFRYPKNVTNWLKVFLAIERLVAVSHAMIHRYNIRSKTTTAEQRGRQRRILLLILLLLVCSFISQHLNFIPDRFISPSVDPIRFVLLAVPNPNFRYGPIAFNAIAYAIVSSVLLDDVLPVTALIILNSILLYRLRQLPLSISGKLVESIWILFFLTLFSIFVTPRSHVLLARYLCRSTLRQSHGDRNYISYVPRY